LRLGALARENLFLASRFKNPSLLASEHLCRHAHIPNHPTLENREFSHKNDGTLLAIGTLTRKFALRQESDYDVETLVNYPRFNVADVPRRNICTAGQTPDSLHQNAPESRRSGHGSQRHEG
jgi:hypothetical protein